MINVTANGKNFTFPAGTSQEDIGVAIDSYFAGQATPTDTIETPEAPQEPVVQSQVTQEQVVQEPITQEPVIEENTSGYTPEGKIDPKSTRWKGMSSLQIIDARNKDVEAGVIPGQIMSDRPTTAVNAQVAGVDPETVIQRNAEALRAKRPELSPQEAYDIERAKLTREGVEYGFAGLTLPVGGVFGTGLKAFGKTLAIGGGLAGGQELLGQATEAGMMGNTDALNAAKVGEQALIGLAFTGGIGALGEGLRAMSNVMNRKLSNVAQKIDSEKLRTVQEMNKLTATRPGEEALDVRFTAEQLLPDSKLVKTLAFVRDQSPVASMTNFVSRSGRSMLEKQSRAGADIAERVVQDSRKAATDSIGGARNVIESQNTPDPLARLSGDAGDVLYKKATPKAETATEFLSEAPGLYIKNTKEKARAMYEKQLGTLNDMLASSGKAGNLPATETKSLADSIIKDVEGRRRLALGPNAKSHINTVRELTKSTPRDFNDYNRLKVDLNELARNASAKGDYQASNMYKDLAQTVKADAQRYADDMGADVGTLWKEADREWAKYSGLAGDKFNKRLANDQFDATTVNKIINGDAAPEKVSKIIDEMRSTGNDELVPGFQQSLKSKIVDNAYKSATDKATADFNFGMFGKTLRKNADTMKAAFKDSPEIADGMRAIGDVFDTMRSADINRQPFGELKTMAKQVAGGFVSAGTTGGFIGPFAQVTAGKLADMSLDALSRFIHKNADDLTRFEKASNPLEKSELANKIAKALALYDVNDEE